MESVSFTFSSVKNTSKFILERVGGKVDFYPGRTFPGERFFVKCSSPSWDSFFFLFIFFLDETEKLFANERAPPFRKEIIILRIIIILSISTVCKILLKL